VDEKGKGLASSPVFE
jgi:hypothetical protein